MEDETKKQKLKQQQTGRRRESGNDWNLNLKEKMCKLIDSFTKWGLETDYSSVSACMLMFAI